MSIIKDNVSGILAELPPGVRLVAAAKARTPAEILEAVEAGWRSSARIMFKKRLKPSPPSGAGPNGTSSATSRRTKPKKRSRSSI